MNSLIPSIKTQCFISTENKKVVDYFFSHHNNGD
jgi:hypothetical protein